MAEDRGQMNWEQQKAKEILSELDEIKTADKQKIINWNIKARTFLVFAAIRKLKR